MEFEKFERNELIENLDEFNLLYKKRVIKDQSCGMRSPHLFYAWFIMKKLNPKFIIESGVWKGMGTWIFEKACPGSKIFSIDPDPEPREYTSQNSVYSTTDFLSQDWSSLDPSETVIFFDDHQNPMERIKFAKKMGFKKLIFEDNYPNNQGDCYSLKKVLSQKDWVIDSQGIKNWFSSIKEDYDFISDCVSIYQEMPPIYKIDKTRWGDDWTDEQYPTPSPLMTEPNLFPEFYEESKYYTWICYVELK